MKYPLLFSLQLSISAAVGCSVFKPSQCEDPTALSDGYVECSDGAINRVSPDACEVLTTEPTCEGTEDERSCETDADCTAAPNGTCLSGDSWDYYGYYESYTYCGCAYPCSSDADCDSDQVCLCPSVGPDSTAYCVAADCSSNDDCAQGECGLSKWNGGCGVTASLHCRDDGDDECRVQEECATDGGCGVDHWAGETTWACQQQECAIGRPLTIAAHARTAPLSAETGWSTGAFSLDHSSPEAAEQWAQIALLEHASVASFARFTLQLMAMGAPAELLARTQRAAADEVAHAEGAFAVAAALSGAPVSPGPLPLSDLSIPLSPAEILGALIEEGCVGETLGAAEAALARSGCVSPSITALLERIQADETEHAALAWATLRWMLEQDPALIPLAAAHFSTAIKAALQRPLTAPGHPTLGLPAGPARFAIHQQAIAAVIQPAAAALLGAAGFSGEERRPPSA